MEWLKPSNSSPTISFGLVSTGPSALTSTHETLASTQKLPNISCTDYSTPPPIPSECWHDVSLDFVFSLLMSSGFNSILVVKDRLSKCAHCLPFLMTINAPITADLFFRKIF
jgi:hypothetical protein